MKFSVIVPVHNADRFLKNAVDSVLKQTGQNRYQVELVLVENGSLDGSPKLCDDYAATYHFITALHREKIGAYAARRLGMETAGGEWLLFVDADDSLADGSLENLYAFIKEHGETEAAPDMIFYNYERVSPEGTTVRTFPFEAGKVYSGKEKKAFYDVMCKGDLLNPLWNKCVKRDLALASLASDTTIFLNHGEDLLQTAQLLDKAESISYLDRVIYRYNADNAGLTGSYHSEYLPNQTYAWEKFDELFSKWEKTPGEYSAMTDQRKTLTCSIAVKSLMSSDLKKSELADRLKEMLADPFYMKHYAGSLPEWAPEEDVFFHDLQMAQDPYKKLMAYVSKYRLKSFIKERIRK